MGHIVAGVKIDADFVSNSIGGRSASTDPENRTSLRRALAGLDKGFWTINGSHSTVEPEADLRAIPRARWSIVTVLVLTHTTYRIQ
jgi:hypothetical protein